MIRSILGMKTFTVLAVLIAVVVIFAACANNDAPAAGSASADSVTLTVWESIGGPDEWIRQAGAAFTAIHPHITVEFVHVELGDTTSQIMLDGPAGVGPDMFAAPHDRLGDLISAGHIAPISENYLINILDGSRLAVTQGGQT